MVDIRICENRVNEVKNKVLGSWMAVTGVKNGEIYSIQFDRQIRVTQRVRIKGLLELDNMNFQEKTNLAKFKFISDSK